MHIREYQNWLEEWDKDRNWDKVLLSHSLAHAIEELGEISRLVQIFEGYRTVDPENIESVRADLALELSDLQVMIFKIAYSCGIDMESAMILGQEKADDRFPDPDQGIEEREAYCRRFRTYVEKHGLLECSPDRPKP